MRDGLLSQGPGDARCHIVLAHGAGAPMTSPFMESIARLLVERGLQVTRFEFAYMAARRTGVRKPPPRAERLKDEYEAVVARLAGSNPKGQSLVFGGKSMGGRVASLVADDLRAKGLVAGLVCLGYPFHPPKKPDQLRTAHLEGLACPALIVQGERDPFGTRSEVYNYELSSAIKLHWAVDGDHDLSPRKASGATHPQNLVAAADAIAGFCASLTGARGSVKASPKRPKARD